MTFELNTKREVLDSLPHAPPSDPRAVDGTTFLPGQGQQTVAVAQLKSPRRLDVAKYRPGRRCHRKYKNGNVHTKGMLNGCDSGIHTFRSYQVTVFVHTLRARRLKHIWRCLCAIKVILHMKSYNAPNHPRHKVGGRENRGRICVTHHWWQNRIVTPNVNN